MRSMILSIGGVLLLVLIFCPFLFWGRRILRSFKEFPSSVRWTTALILTWQAFQLFLHFPGLISSDDVNLWESLRQSHVPSAWHSLTYSFVTHGWAWITGGPYHLSFLNFALFGFLLFLVFRTFPSKISGWTLLGLTVIFAMPQSSALVLFQNRDSLNSLLVLWLFLGFLAPATPAKKDPWFHPWTLMSLSLVLGDLRQEGKLLLVLTPLILWWEQKSPLSSLAKRAAVLAMAAVVLYGLPSKVLHLDPYTSTYQSTLLLNPLGHIFQTRGTEAATPEEIQKIEKLVLISDLIKNHTPLDIGPFHGGNVRNLPPEEFKEAESAIFAVFRKNADLVLENRLFLMSNMLNFRGSPMMFSTEFPPTSQPAQTHLAEMKRVAYGLPRSL
ncbi:MAG TPA: hypothetical protein PL182_02835, partial [Pseudobdellovibrionaceae bacterium]|nr:hypothetical protein [Pseudobdellovibrionaceae bacterium]